jgi:hypothetical protein
MTTMSHRPRTTPRLESLEGRALLSTVVVMGHEPDNQPSQATPAQVQVGGGTLVVGTLPKASDVDYYRIHANGGTTVFLNVKTFGALKDSVVAMSSTGKPLAAILPGGPAVTSMVMPANHTILLRVTGVGQGSSLYAIGVIDLAPHVTGNQAKEAPNPNTAEVEPDDTLAQATPFNLNTTGTATLTGTIASPTDQDYFTFTPAKSGRVTVAFRQNPQTHVQLQVVDSTGRGYLTISSDRSNIINAFSVNAGSKYYFHLNSPGGQPSPYMVDVRLS